MKEEKIEAEGRFYRRCAELLGVPDSYHPYPYSRRTRWNNRTAGNGRFVGYGIIRLFGSTVHMSLRTPIVVNTWFKSTDEALSFLEKAVERT